MLVPAVFTDWCRLVWPSALHPFLPCAGHAHHALARHTKLAALDECSIGATKAGMAGKQGAARVTGQGSMWQEGKATLSISACKHGGSGVRVLDVAATASPLGIHGVGGHATLDPCTAAATAKNESH
jgi:hypothetical protein